MRRQRTNIVKLDTFAQETLGVFLEKKWTLYCWQFAQATIAGALGAIAFIPELESPWWKLPLYFAGVFVFKRASMMIARRVFAGDGWWQATNVFVPAFLIAFLPAAMIRWTSWTIIALPVVMAGSFVIGVVYTPSRIAFSRNFFAWVWAAAPLTTIASVVGWLLLRFTAPLTLQNALIGGGLAGFLHILLTTLLLEYMWDPAAQLSQRGQLAADKEEEFTESLAIHENAIELEPDKAPLYAARAETYLKQGRWDDANADIARALELDPQSPEARVLQANRLLEAGNVDAAIAAYDAIIDYKSDFDRAYLGRARARSLQGDFERALDDCDRSAQFADDVVLTSATRAGILYRKGSYESAIRQASHTLTLKTATPIAYAMALVTRGKCYAAQDKDQLALEDFQNALGRTSDALITKEVEEAALTLNLPTPSSNGHGRTDLPNQGTDLSPLQTDSPIGQSVLPGDMKPEASPTVRLYRFKVFLLALVGYAYIYLAPILLLLLVALLVWSVRAGAGLNSRIVEAETALLILAAALLRSICVRPHAPIDIELSREQAPALFDTVEEIRRELNAPHVHHIMLGQGLDISLATLPRLGLFGQTRRYLTVGLPLLFAASAAEVRALLTHQLGHLARTSANSRFDSWIYQLRAQWLVMRSRLQAKFYWLTSLFNRFFKRYVEFFRRYSIDLVKGREFDADRLAANLNGPETTADALIKCAVYLPYLYRDFWDRVNERVKTESSPPTAYTEMRALRLEPDPDQAEKWLREALVNRSFLDDEHPPLKDRLAALGQQPRVPALAAVSAAEVYLGEHLQELTSQLDRAFQRIEADWWSEQREELLAEPENEKSVEEIEEELENLVSEFGPAGEEGTAQRILAQQKALRQSQKHYQSIENSAAERRDVSHLDRLSRHDLPAGVVEQLRDELEKDARVREAYLVRKEVRYQTERPFHALGVVIERPWYKQLVHEWSYTRQVRYKLQTPQDLYTFELAPYNKRLRDVMRSVDNSLIYQRA